MKDLRIARLWKGRTNMRKITLALSLIVVCSQLGCAEPVVDFHHTCSIDSATAATIEFVNNSAVSITTYWLDFECREVEYAVVAPGTSYTQPTFVSHPWVIRDTATGALLMNVAAPTAAGTVVVNYP